MFSKNSEYLNWPNIISASRIALTPVIVLCWNHGNQLLTGALLIIAVISDFLDGWLARKTGQVTGLGKLFDPLADKILIVAILIMVGTKYLSAYQIGLLVILELTLIASPTLNLVFQVKRKLGSNVFGKIKMILECSIIFFMFVNPTQFISLIRWMMWLAIIAACLSLFLHFLNKEKT